MVSRRSLPWFAWLLVAAAWCPAGADSRRIAADGTVHRIDVETNQTTSKGTLLRHRRTLGVTTSDSLVVPGTDDGSCDREPAIEIDPQAGSVWLTWVRANASGSQIMLARFDGVAWAMPKAVSAPSGDLHEPQIRVAQNLVHLVWRQDGSSGTIFWRESVNRVGMDPAFGPEPLPVPSTISSGFNPDPPSDLSYFTGGVPGLTSGDPTRMVTWGVRDEPVPVGYIAVSQVAAGSPAPTQTDAHWRSGRMVVGGVSGSNLFYQWWSKEAGWSSVGAVPIDAVKPVPDAWRLVDDLISRGTAGP